MNTNEVSPTDRLFDLVTELLQDREDGLRPGEIRDTVEEAIRQWREGNTP